MTSPKYKQVRQQTYQLFIRIKKDSRIKVGELGTFNFPSGDYVYTGSAKTNLEARIIRHQATKKKLRWHIDYLLADVNAEIIKVKKSTHGECVVNRRTAGEILVEKFGASDCRNHCGSHLKYLGKNRIKGWEFKLFEDN